MSDMLSIAVSGLRAFQRALDTTSHNVANASTPGYSRQSVSLVTSEPEVYGSAAIGTGVVVQGVSRSSNDLLSAQMWRASSSLSRLDTYAQKAGALNNLFADSSTGLSVALQKFTNAVQGVANTPSSTAARQVLLSESGGLVTRLQTYESRLDEIDTEVNDQLRGEVASINSIASNISRLNQEIVRAQSQGAAPSDLLDARDSQLQQLASKLDTSVVRQSDGAINVFVGNGQALVLGGTTSTLVARADAFQPSRVTIAFQSANGTFDVSSALSGGTVGGLLDFRREMLDPARNQLGQMAVALADVTNAQHREGIDLSGNMGGDLFAIGPVLTQSANTNTGSAALAVTRTGAGASTAYNYVMSYDGSAWKMNRADTGAPVTLAGTGTPGDPFVAEGLSVVVSGSAAAGDRFLVRPTAGAIDGMSVLVSDPGRIAAAAPIRTSASASNTGSAVISAGEVLGAGNVHLRSTATLQFIDATHYSVNGAGSYAFTPGSNIDVNGWRVQISGTPAAGDVFTVSDNAGGTGDNRNALAMVDSLASGVLAGGSESLNGAAARFIGFIGVSTSQANTSRDAQQVIFDDSQSAVQNLSGVNLDEEAANMLRYQQAYQAAAQLIRVTQTMFDTLLNATGR